MWKLEKTKKPKANLITKLDTKLMCKTTEYKFRFGAFGSGVNEKYFFSLSLRSVNKKPHSYISRWNIADWKFDGHTMVVAKPITAFTMSKCGNLIAFGTSEGSVGLFNASRMRNKWVRNNAHGFGVSSILFTDDSKQIISGSIDKSLKKYDIDREDKSGYSFLWSTLLILIVALIAIVIGVWRIELTKSVKQ